MRQQTDFLSAEKCSAAEIGRELVHVAADDVAQEVAYMQDGAIVLNNHRQIVFANEHFVSLVGFASLASMIGRRLGEVFMCHHVSANKGGCGTSNHCRDCALAQALDKCMNGGGLQRGVCRLCSDLIVIDHVPIAFTIIPLLIAGSNYFVVSCVPDPTFKNDQSVN